MNNFTNLTSTTLPRVTQAQPYQKIRSNPQPFLVATILFAIVLNTVAFFHQLVPTPFPFLLVTTFFIFLFQ